MNKIDRVFYLSGLTLFILLLIVAILQSANILILTDVGLPCSFRLMTGYFCPGCGGTHAIVALAGGDLLSSFRYHPFVPYTACIFAAFVIWNTVALIGNRILLKKADHATMSKRSRRGEFFSHTPIPFMHFHAIYLYIGLAIIFIQWFVKNLC